MTTAYLIRKYHERCTTGVMVAIAATGNILMSCVCLELPWRDNERRVSCIPEGEYLVRQRRSDKFGTHFHILDVPGRDWILQHPGNFTSDILGCQLPGSSLLDINGDGIPDIRNTRDTLKKMLALLGKEYRLLISSEKPPAFEHRISPKTLLPIIPNP